MNAPSRMPQLLTVGLLIIAGAISYYGVRRGDLPAEVVFSGDRPTAVPRTGDAVAEQLASISVPAITLPHFEPIMPPGESRDVFMANCVSCHSPRLVTNQPFFSRDKWEATVQKMIDVFGAAIADEDKSKTVDYLVSIRGSENNAGHQN